MGHTHRKPKIPEDFSILLFGEGFSIFGHHNRFRLQGFPEKAWMVVRLGWRLFFPSLHQTKQKSSPRAKNESKKEKKEAPLPGIEPGVAG